jgi:hypothetical protein
MGRRSKVAVTVVLIGLGLALVLLYQWYPKNCPEGAPAPPCRPIHPVPAIITAVISMLIALGIMLWPRRMRRTR